MTGGTHIGVEADPSGMSEESSGPEVAASDLTRPRPGPDALYGDNPTPPQLENGFG